MLIVLTKTQIMDKKPVTIALFLVVIFIVSGLKVDVLSYDHSFTFECLPNPSKPQYDGGIVINPEFNDGLKGWNSSGDARIEHRIEENGENRFIAILNSTQSLDIVSQNFYLEEGKLYTFSAWLRVNQGNAKIAAAFKMPTYIVRAGWAEAKSGCWSMLKGGLIVNSSGPADLYFESNNSKVEIWADSISLQPFTEEQWKSHQQKSIEKVRKSSVKLVVVDESGNRIPNATFNIKAKRMSYPFGCASTKYITTNTAYQSWFSDRFGVTTFENELKWYANERTQNKVDYNVSDAMFEFFKRNNIHVRGHNIFWDNERYQPSWVPNLPIDQLRQATDARWKSVVQRYAGQVIAWDVVNENLHYNFFESKLGADFSTKTFKNVHTIDSQTTLFLNDYATIEKSGEGSADPTKYLAKIQEMKSGGYTGPLGIGVEGHFSVPDLPYVRASIDKLATIGLPIWVTEVDVGSGQDQAMFLEQILRELHSHPKVDGIIMWAAWNPEGCFRMCLTDNNFNNLPTGDVVDKLLAEWGRGGVTTGSTDSNGHFGVRLFHGHYEATINHPSFNSTVVHSFDVHSLDDVLDEHVVYVNV